MLHRGSLPFPLVLTAAVPDDYAFVSRLRRCRIYLVERQAVGLPEHCGLHCAAVDDDLAPAYGTEVLCGREVEFTRALDHDLTVAEGCEILLIDTDVCTEHIAEGHLRYGLGHTT